MTQDFAKIRPEPLLEKKPAQTPPAWSMLVTGVVVGVALGVFASVLLYISGYVPALATNPVSEPPNTVTATQAEQQATNGAETPALQLEFYTELANYEVDVDATPVEINEERVNEPLPVSYMLQSGAFQQRELANQEMQRQQSLGLEVMVKVEELTGRTLYLVQSGPYATRGQLDAAETLLRRYNIPSLRTQVQ